MSNNGQSKLVFVVQLILTSIVLFQIVFLLRKNTIKNKPTAPYWWLKSLANPWNFSGIIGVISVVSQCQSLSLSLLMWLICQHF